MSTIPSESLLTQLKWRYATKQFDPTKKLDAATWAALAESLVLTPSSYGLQPWKFLAVTSPELKKALRPLSWGQAQVEDCSHHLVLLGRTGLTEVDLDRFVNATAATRGVTTESLAGYKGFMMKDLIEGPRSKTIAEWAARQVYIALGQLMTSCALLGLDACPMEGIDPAGYDKVLGLEGTGYTTRVACPVGYRLATDKYAALAKVRYAVKDVVEVR